MRIQIAATFALLLAACATGAATLSPLPNVTQAPQPREPRFEDRIKTFEETKEPACATLFVGSSTFARWTDIKADFPTRKVINHGFGGSTSWEVDHYFDRAVAPFKPAQIVYYAGDNDLSAKRTPDEVFADFVGFMRKKEKSLGATPVWYISVKPSILRWDIRDQMHAVNAKVKALADQRADLAYVDIWPVMLKPDGQPKAIFVADNLHMTREGYQLWAPIVNKALDQGQETRAPGC